MTNQTPLSIMRHSCSHLLAAAVLQLFPDTKLGIGPAIENGFYYDFQFSQTFTEESLDRLTKIMGELVKKNLPFEKEEITTAEALKLFKDQPFKKILVEELTAKGEKTVSIYKTGDFIDLCAGPHVQTTQEIGPFKLTSVAGAYWQGSEKNQMLTRIYGIGFATQAELDDYLKFLDESKKRDHRTIGKELDLFSIDKKVGPGLILWHPKLSLVRELIELYWRQEHRRRGYEYVYTPHVGLADLWQTSGHLGFFKEGMFPPMSMTTKNEKEKTTYYAKPMNCPFHIQIYKSRLRSYRELPLRWCELGTVYRYEESGVLHGMLRVRGFTQDDAHIICREDQFVSEVNRVIDFALDLNRTFGFKDLKVYLSLRNPAEQEKYVGDKQIWESSEKTLQKILEDRKIEYQKDVSGAKFYGPAIDLKAVDVLGREWQGTTIQLDFNEPEKFQMTYIGQDGKEHAPVMLHRTLLGSMERFVATLIEQYGGAFPVWLAPLQVQIIPIASRHQDYASQIESRLQKEGLRVKVNDSEETMQAKVRNGELEKIPYFLIVGDREVENQNLSVRARGQKDLGTMALEDFLTQIKEEIENKS